jgi:hypothetical protein
MEKRKDVGLIFQFDPKRLRPCLIYFLVGIPNFSPSLDLYSSAYYVFLSPH